jgi:hypothetical protein
MLAERIIALAWRLKRAEWMESGVLNVLSSNGDIVARVDNRQQRISPREFRILNETLHDALRSDRPRKFSAAVDKLAKLVRPNFKASPHAVLGCIAIEDFAQSNVLERLLRYQREIERSLYKALLELQKTQHLRKRSESSIIDAEPAVPAEQKNTPEKSA